MIIAVWMRAAAPGWRAMASTAEATALPCPSAHRPAAKAMAKPATRTAYGPTRLPPPAGASAASASPGTARTARPARMSERRTTALLCTCGLLVMRRMVLAPVMLGLLDGSRDVEHREHHEDERLEERHQDLERVQEPDGEDNHHQAAEAADDGAERIAGQGPADEAVEAHQEEDDRQQDVTAEHVAEQPQRERQRPGQVADDLDDEHQRLQRERYRPHEMLQIGERA